MEKQPMPCACKWETRLSAKRSINNFSDNRGSLPRAAQGVNPLFTLGHMVATPGALAAIEKSGQPPGDFLTRHVSGDWEDVPPEDNAENEPSLQHGYRLLSACHTSAGDKLAGLSLPDVSCTFWPRGIARSGVGDDQGEVLNTKNGSEQEFVETQ
jgi:hypothetical protein